MDVQLLSVGGRCAKETSRDQEGRWQVEPSGSDDEALGSERCRQALTAQRASETELIRELDVIDASMPPSLPKRRKRKKRRKRWTRRPLLSCSS